MRWLPFFPWAFTKKRALLPLRRKLSAPRSQRAMCRPALERLEDRLLLAAISWTNLAGGDWDTPGNWSSGNLPTASDDVVLSANLVAGAGITDNQGISESVNSLTSSDRVTFSGGNLAVATSATIKGAGSFNALSGTTVSTGGPFNK